jgi:dTDP-4-dehydrorhamnose 3,5-epimerase
MKATPLAIPEVMLIEPKVFGDDRGFFLESFNQQAYNEATGTDHQFVQHYQLPPHAQGKLVRVVRGAVFDVAVDIRKGSPTFGQWVGAGLTEDNHRQLWVPPGFAHGFVVLSDSADFLYKATSFYAPQADRGIAWNDPAIGVQWPQLDVELSLSDKDLRQPLLADAELA